MKLRRLRIKIFYEAKFNAINFLNNHRFKGKIRPRKYGRIRSESIHRGLRNLKVLITMSQNSTFPVI